MELIEKFKFNRIKKNNPESRIWQRTWEYQKTRNKLAEALKKWDENAEKSARMDYLVEKVVSKEVTKDLNKELLNNSDKEFIISLSKEDLDKFLWLLFDKLMVKVNSIYESANREAEELNELDVNWFLAINKVFDYIKENRKDVRIKRFYFWPKFQLGEYRKLSQPAWIYYDD